MGNKTNYVPIETIYHMVNEDLKISIEELKVNAKKVQVSVVKEDFENSLSHISKFLMPDSMDGMISFKKLKVKDNWDKGDIKLTKKNVQNTMYYEQCQTKLGLYEYLCFQIEKEKRQLFMLLQLTEQMKVERNDNLKEVFEYLNIRLNHTGDILLDDAIGLATYIICKYQNLIQMDTYATDIKTELNQLFFTDPDLDHADWSCLSGDKYQIVKQKTW